MIFLGYIAATKRRENANVHPWTMTWTGAFCERLRFDRGASLQGSEKLDHRR